MDHAMIVALVNNATLLLALTIVYELKGLIIPQKRVWQDIFSGLLIGLIGVAIMSVPFVLKPGLVYDTRSILISTTALSFGALPTIIAVAGIFAAAIGRAKSNIDNLIWESLLASIVEDDPNSIAVLDKNMKFMYASRKYLSDFKIIEPNIIGKNFYTVFPNMNDRYINILNRAIEGEVFLSAEEELVMLQDVPVLMMTGEPTIETAITSLQRGAFDYLNKPIQKDALLKSVRQAAQYRSLALEKHQLEAERQIYQKDLEATVRNRTADLDRSMQSTIKVMTSLVDSRDHYTSGHQIRVGNLSAAIATELGMKQFDITGIRVTGYLHDIGKLAIPAEILVKPAKLTYQEFEIVKTHSECGYGILSDLILPWPVAEIVYQHHERVDGSGYPRKLLGDMICIEAKILTVADVVEAMSSHRPYRPALGLDEAISEISAKSGSAFDAEVVDACLKVVNRKGFEFESQYIESSFIDFERSNR